MQVRGLDQVRAAHLAAESTAAAAGAPSSRGVPAAREGLRAANTAQQQQHPQHQQGATKKRSVNSNL